MSPVRGGCDRREGRLRVVPVHARDGRGGPQKMRLRVLGARAGIETAVDTHRFLFGTAGDSRFDPVLDRTVREVGGEQCCWVGTHGGAGVKDVSG